MATTVFCCQCLQDVDPYTHGDCFQTLNDYLNLDERDDTGNFQQNQVDQPHQAINSVELRRDYNLEKRKPDFDHETSVKTPKTVITSNRSSTSLRIPGALNPIVQKPQNSEYGNKISRHKGDYELYYDASESSNTENFRRTNLETNTAFHPTAYNNHTTDHKAFGNVGQQRYEFQSNNQQCNESNEFLQDNSQLVYGQPYGTNIFQPGEISNFRTNFPNSSHENKSKCFGYMENDPYVYSPKLQNDYSSFGSHTGIKHLQSNTSVEDYRQNPMTLPSGSQHTRDLNYATRNEITLNNDIGLLRHNKHPSTDLVSNKEIQYDGRSSFSTLQPSNAYGSHTSITNLRSKTRVEDYRQNPMTLPSGSQNMGDLSYVMKKEITLNNDIGLLRHNNYPSTDLVSKKEIQNDGRSNFSTLQPSYALKTFAESPQQINAENITLKYQENYILQNEARNISHKSVQHKNAEEKIVDKSTQQKNIDEMVQEKNTDQNAHHKNTQQKNANINAQQKYADESTEEQDLKLENFENRSHQENAKKIAKQENAEKIAKQENAEKIAKQENAEKIAKQENAEKIAKQENAEEIAKQENAEEIAKQENAEQNVEQENSNIFTGKGYDSIDDFIKALYDGTLYKRY